MLAELGLAVALLIGRGLLGHVEDFALGEQISSLVVGESVRVGIGGAATAGEAVVGGGAERGAAGIGIGSERSQTLGVFGRLAIVHQDAGVLGAEIGSLATARSAAANENVTGERELFRRCKRFRGDGAEMRIVRAEHAVPAGNH